MSDPRPPEDDRPPDDKPLGEQLVEEIKHEIEEVVEEVRDHVPQPVRWTIGKIVMLATLGLAGLLLLVLVTAIAYVANRTEWAAQELALVVNQTLASRSDVLLAIGDIKGNPLTGVRVVHPTIRYKDDRGPNLLEASSMRLQYSAFQLLSGKRAAIVVEIDKPIVRFTRGADGRLRIPKWNPGPPSTRPARGFDFIVRLRDAQVRMPEPENAIEGLTLDASASTGRPTTVDIRSLTWARGPHHTVLQRFAGDLSVADSVHMRIRELRTPDLALRGRADWMRPSGEKIVVAVVDRVRWSWLADVFRNKTLDVPGEGRFVVRAHGGDNWRGHVETRSTWSDLPLAAEGDFLWGDGKLALEPLSGTSPAGNLEGRVAWSKQGWEVAGDADHADPARWNAIGIKGWPRGDLNGRFRYQVDTRARPSARLVAQLETTEWSGWHADSGGVVVDFPAVGPDSFHVRAYRRGGQMLLAGASDHGAWTGDWEARRFPLDEWPDGRASGLKGTLATGAGTVTGRGGRLEVTGTLEGVATDWLGARMARWRLDDVDGVLLPAPDLDARATLADVQFLGLHWDSAGAPIHLGDGNVVFEGLRMHAGDTLVTMNARSEWARGGWRLEASRAEMRSRTFAWTAEPPLLLRGDKAGVTFERLIATDGPARVSAEGRWAVPGGSYDFTGRGERLDLARLGLPPEWQLAGAAGGELRVRGVAGDPRWELRASASRPAWQGHAADSIALDVGGAPSRLDVRSFAFTLDGGALLGEGDVEGTRIAWPDTLNGNRVIDWIAGASQWRGRLRASRFPLDRLSHVAPKAEGLRGRVDGTLAIGGRPARPDLQLDAEARPLSWHNMQVDAVAAKAGYRDGRLKVSDLRMTRQDVVSRVTGEMPLQLALGRRPVVPDEPMSWRLDLPNGDLALVPVFVRQIGSASGRMALDARVEGTPKKPRLSGTAAILDGRVRLAGRDEVLESVNARFTLGESQIRLDTLTAAQNTKQGVRGRVAAGGIIRISESGLDGYRFNVSMRDFTAIETGSYAARIDGNFVVTDGPRIAGQVVPRVEGALEVLQAVVLYDFTKQTEVQQVAASTQALPWVYHLEVHANDNLRWQPEDADIEFSADLEVEQTATELIIFGEMEALRGTYYFLSNRFNVDRARLTFDNVRGVDPLIDAEATTRLNLARTVLVGAGAQSAVAERATITVTIQGRASEPTFIFASDVAGLDEAAILSELTVGRFNSNDRVGSSADSWVTQRINRQLSAELSRLFQGYLTDWEVARQGGGLIRGGGDVIVRVGAPITPELFLRVGSRLPGTSVSPVDATVGDVFERNVEAEYRLTRHFSITSELVQQRSVTTQKTSTPFNVSLRGRWEY